VSKKVASANVEISGEGIKQGCSTPPCERHWDSAARAEQGLHVGKSGCEHTVIAASVDTLCIVATMIVGSSSRYQEKVLGEDARGYCADVAGKVRHCGECEGSLASVRPSCDHAADAMSAEAASF
jgi:hypothetical protein